MAGILLSLLIAAGCSSDTAPDCPPDRHAEGNRCICNDGTDINGICIAVPTDGDTDIMPDDEEPDLPDDDADTAEQDMDDNIPEDSGDQDIVDPEPEPDPDPDPDPEPDIDEDTDIPQEQPLYIFPQPQIIFSLARVVNLKLPPDPDIILIGASVNGTIGETDQYNLYTAGAAGESPEFFATVSWDSGERQWLDVTITTDGLNVIFSNFLNFRDVLLIKALSDENAYIIENQSYYPGHYALSPDGRWLAYGKGQPAQNNGLLPAVWTYDLHNMADKWLIATNVVASSFEFTRDSQRLIIGRSTAGSDRNYDLLSATAQGSASQVIASQLAHPYFTVAANCDSVLYMKRQTVNPSLLSLMISDTAGTESSTLDTFTWQEAVFGPQDMQSTASCSHVLYAATTGGGEHLWRLTDSDADDIVTVTDPVTGTVYLAPNGQYAVRMNHDTGELAILDIFKQQDIYTATTLLSRRPVFSRDGTRVFWAQTMPPEHPQASHSMVMAFSYTTGFAYILGDKADGVVIEPNENTATLYYSTKTGDLGTVPLNYSIRFP